MSGLTDEMRAEMGAIQAGMSQTRRSPVGAKRLRYVDGEPVWTDDPAPVWAARSMFPYKSVQMATDPEDIPSRMEYLRRYAEGPAKYTEFDRDGCPIITSTVQHDDLAKTLKMKTGRDGYGHLDEHGKFQNSGRRRNDEIQEGRAKVRRAIQELEAMPEEVPSGVVADLLDEYDIFPNEENTG